MPGFFSIPLSGTIARYREMSTRQDVADRERGLPEALRPQVQQVEVPAFLPPRTFSGDFFSSVSTSSPPTPVQQRFFHPETESISDNVCEQYKRQFEKDYDIWIEGGFLWFHIKSQDDLLVWESSDEGAESFVRKPTVLVRRTEPPPLSKKEGIKFHVSIDHTPQQYFAGTLAVIELLRKRKHPHFKMVLPSFLSKPEYAEAGREITIYMYMFAECICEEGCFSYEASQLICDINRALAIQRVRPYLDKTDRQIPPRKDTIIPGSSSVTFRDDGSRQHVKALPRHSVVDLHPDIFQALDKGVQVGFR